jgi:predicted aspartyl protease
MGNGKQPAQGPDPSQSHRIEGFSPPKQGQVVDPPNSEPAAHPPKSQLTLKQLKVNVNLTNPGLMMFDILLQGRTYHALIDSGANGLFMGRKAVDKLKLKTFEKSEADRVKHADGSYIDSDSVLRTTFSLGKYKDVDTFHVLYLPAFDIILGMPRLRRLNPRIDWKKRTMTVKQNGAYHKLHVAISAEDAHLANLLLSALEFKQALKKKGNQVYLVTLNHLENPDGSPIKATSHLVGKPLSAEWQARLKDIVDRYQDVISPDPNWKPDFPPERAVDHIIEKIP